MKTPTFFLSFINALYMFSYEALVESCANIFLLKGDTLSQISCLLGKTKFFKSVALDFIWPAPYNFCTLFVTYSQTLSVEEFFSKPPGELEILR